MPLRFATAPCGALRSANTLCKMRLTDLKNCLVLCRCSHNEHASRMQIKTNAVCRNGVMRISDWKIFQLLSAFVISFQCFAAGNTVDVYEKYHSNDAIHGLFEIREEAIAFINRENIQGGTKFEVVGPNLKTLVPRCAVPLRAMWAPSGRGLTGKNVSVICARTSDINYQKWDVLVPVIIPK
jgi:hypothetical protein